jgi:hypothetical protein
MKTTALLSITFFLAAAILDMSNMAAAATAPNFTGDPDAMQFVTSDIVNFWRAFDEAQPEIRPEAFQREYFDKGSAGLTAFKRERIDACGLVPAIQKYRRFYTSIRPSTLRIDEMVPRMRAAFRKFKSLYEEAVFPNVYFLIGCMSSGGTATDDGLLIGAEMYGRTAGMPEEELNASLKSVIKPVDLIPHIVAHELIHYEQHYPTTSETTLLSQSIKEGSADFLGEMISGKHINEIAHKYGDPRESVLWARFKTEMHTADLRNWLYNGWSVKDQPADLGYYIGYKITKSYYDRASDKKAAIKQILTIQDFDRFLSESKYDPPQSERIEP